MEQKRNINAAIMGQMRGVLSFLANPPHLKHPFLRLGSPHFKSPSCSSKSGDSLQQCSEQGIPQGSYRPLHHWFAS